MSLTRIAVLSSAALMLAACTQPAGQPAAPADKGAAPAAGAGAQPAPTAATPAPGPRTLTPEGLGPVKIGMTTADARKALGEAVIAGDTAGEIPGGCVEIRLKGDYAGVWLMAEEGKITRISAGEGSSILTDKGLGVGATPAAVRAAYPQGLVAEPHKYVAAPAEYLTIWTVPEQKGIRYEVNDKGVVSFIRAGGPSIAYVEGCL